VCIGCKAPCNICFSCCDSRPRITSTTSAGSWSEGSEAKNENYLRRRRLLLFRASRHALPRKSLVHHQVCFCVYVCIGCKAPCNICFACSVILEFTDPEGIPDSLCCFTCVAWRKHHTGVDPKRASFASFTCLAALLTLLRFLCFRCLLCFLGFFLLRSCSASLALLPSPRGVSRGGFPGSRRLVENHSIPCAETLRNDGVPAPGHLV